MKLTAERLAEALADAMEEAGTDRLSIGALRAIATPGEWLWENEQKVKAALEKALATLGKRRMMP